MVPLLPALVLPASGFDAMLTSCSGTTSSLVLQTVPTHPSLAICLGCPGTCHNSQTFTHSYTTVLSASCVSTAQALEARKRTVITSHGGI